MKKKTKNRCGILQSDNRFDIQRIHKQNRGAELNYSKCMHVVMW